MGLFDILTPITQGLGQAAGAVANVASNTASTIQSAISGGVSAASSAISPTVSSVTQGVSQYVSPVAKAIGYVSPLTQYSQSGAGVNEAILSSAPRTSGGQPYVSQQQISAVAAPPTIQQPQSFNPVQSAIGFVGGIPQTVSSLGQGALTAISPATQMIAQQAPIAAMAPMAAIAPLPVLVGLGALGALRSSNPTQFKPSDVSAVTGGADYSGAIATTVPTSSLPTTSPDGTVTFYTPYGKKAAIEVQNVKLGYDKYGNIEAYQKPYGHSTYNLVSSGSTAALQSGMFTVGRPQTPIVYTQESGGTKFAPSANIPLAQQVLARPEAYSSQGAEVYGGYVRPLTGATVQSTGAQLSTYENPYNLANLVNPQAVNVPKSQMVMSNIPWSVPATTPAIFTIGRGGVEGAAQISPEMASVITPAVKEGVLTGRNRVAAGGETITATTPENVEVLVAGGALPRPYVSGSPVAVKAETPASASDWLGNLYRVGGAVPLIGPTLASGAGALGVVSAVQKTYEKSVSPEVALQKYEQRSDIPAVVGEAALAAGDALLALPTSITGKEWTPGSDLLARYGQTGTIASKDFVKQMASIEAQKPQIDAIGSRIEQRNSEIDKFLSGKVNSEGKFVGSDADYATYQNMLSQQKLDVSQYNQYNKNVQDVIATGYRSGAIISTGDGGYQLAPSAARPYGAFSDWSAGAQKYVTGLMVDTNRANILTGKSSEYGITPEKFAAYERTPAFQSAGTFVPKEAVNVLGGGTPMGGFINETINTPQFYEGALKVATNPSELMKFGIQGVELYALTGGLGKLAPAVPATGATGARATVARILNSPLLGPAVGSIFLGQAVDSAAGGFDIGEKGTLVPKVGEAQYRSNLGGLTVNLAVMGGGASLPSIASRIRVGRPPSQDGGAIGASEIGAGHPMTPREYALTSKLGEGEISLEQFNAFMSGRRPSRGVEPSSTINPSISGMSSPTIATPLLESGAGRAVSVPGSTFGGEVGKPSTVGKIGGDMTFWGTTQKLSEGDVVARLDRASKMGTYEVMPPTGVANTRSVINAFSPEFKKLQDVGAKFGYEVGSPVYPTTLNEPAYVTVSKISRQQPVSPLSKSPGLGVPAEDFLSQFYGKKAATPEQISEIIRPTKVAATPEQVITAPTRTAIRFEDMTPEQIAVWKRTGEVPTRMEPHLLSLQPTSEAGVFAGVGKSRGLRAIETYKPSEYLKEGTGGYQYSQKGHEAFAAKWDAKNMDVKLQLPKDVVSFTEPIRMTEGEAKTYIGERFPHRSVADYMEPRNILKIKSISTLKQPTLSPLTEVIASVGETAFSKGFESFSAGRYTKPESPMGASRGRQSQFKKQAAKAELQRQRRSQLPSGIRTDWATIQGRAYDPTKPLGEFIFPEAISISEKPRIVNAVKKWDAADKARENPKSKDIWGAESTAKRLGIEEPKPSRKEVWARRKQESDVADAVEKERAWIMARSGMNVGRSTAIGREGTPPLQALYGGSGSGGGGGGRRSGGYSGTSAVSKNDFGLSGISGLSDVSKLSPVTLKDAIYGRRTRLTISEEPEYYREVPGMTRPTSSQKQSGVVIQEPKQKTSSGQSTESALKVGQEIRAGTLIRPRTTTILGIGIGSKTKQSLSSSQLSNVAQRSDIARISDTLKDVGKIGVSDQIGKIDLKRVSQKNIQKFDNMNILDLIQEPAIKTKVLQKQESKTIQDIIQLPRVEPAQKVVPKEKPEEKVTPKEKVPPPPIVPKIPLPGGFGTGGGGGHAMTGRGKRFREVFQYNFNWRANTALGGRNVKTGGKSSNIGINIPSVGLNTPSTPSSGKLRLNAPTIGKGLVSPKKTVIESSNPSKEIKSSIPKSLKAPEAMRAPKRKSDSTSPLDIGSSLPQKKSGKK